MKVNWNAPFTGWHFLGMVLLVLTWIAISGTKADFDAGRVGKKQTGGTFEDDHLLTIGVIFLLSAGFLFAYYALDIWSAISLGMLVTALICGGAVLYVNAVSRMTLAVLRRKKR